MALHMHFDMFGLPSSAQLLAKSQGCPRQAFCIDNYIYGLQFHLEVTKKNMEERIAHQQAILIPSQYVKSLADLANYDPTFINQNMIIFLDRLCSRSVSI
jgi:GMP synthase (glutamine-hydrolysing)